MKPDITKSQTMSDMSSPSSAFMMTPTTLRSITQMFESEECLKGIQTFETTGDAAKAVAASDFGIKPSRQLNANQKSAAKARSGNTYYNLDSKSWQGGTTTVVTPTGVIASIVEKFESEKENEAEEDQYSDDRSNSSSIVNGYILPEPIIQTNLKQQKAQQQPTRRTMITRSLSNMSNSAGRNSNKTYSDMENRKVTAGRKATKKGRKVQMYDPEDDLSPEERERLYTRRQRNKEAAARCRKRRVDQTNSLQVEVDKWQGKKMALENEIRALTNQRDELEFLLASHCQTAATGQCVLGGVRRRITAPAQIVVRRTSTATMPRQHIRQIQVNNVHQQQHQQHIIVQSQPPVVAVKSEPVIVETINQPYILPEQVAIPQVKDESAVTSLHNTTKAVPNNNAPQQVARRPASLGLSKIAVVQQQHNKTSEHGITIDTPSSIIPSFSLETYASTGLTPTATPVSGFSFPITSGSTPGTLNTPMTTTATIGSSCSTQQRTTEGANGSVPEINSPEAISLVSL